MYSGWEVLPSPSLPTNTSVFKKCLEEWGSASNLEAEVHRGAVPPSLAWNEGHTILSVTKSSSKNPCMLAKIMYDLQTHLRQCGSWCCQFASILKIHFSSTLFSYHLFFHVKKIHLLAKLAFPLLYQKCSFWADLIGDLVKDPKLLCARTIFSLRI